MSYNYDSSVFDNYKNGILYNLPENTLDLNNHYEFTNCFSELTNKLQTSLFDERFPFVVIDVYIKLFKLLAAFIKERCILAFEKGYKYNCNIIDIDLSSFNYNTYFSLFPFFNDGELKEDMLYSGETVGNFSFDDFPQNVKDFYNELRENVLTTFSNLVFNITLHSNESAIPFYDVIAKYYPTYNKIVINRKFTDLLSMIIFI